MTVSVAAKLREDLRGRWIEPDVEQLLCTAVDDLVKFQIVRFLQEHPAAAGDAALFASALGFHSVAKTQVALEELTAAGILRRRLLASGEPTYCLTADRATRQRLEKLCAVSPQSRYFAEIMRRLSAASLRRAEASARRRASSELVSNAE